MARKSRIRARERSRLRSFFARRRSGTNGSGVTPLFGVMSSRNMRKRVLFIQGAGEGTYEEDGELVKSLQDVLGTEYNVLYPKMPEEEDSGYEAWKAQISRELATLDDGIILVGHSVGSSMLLKYLSEENVENSIAGIFLIAAPYWGTGGWQVNEFRLDEGRASKLLKALPIFFYHSRDDHIVPFTHWRCMQESFRRELFANSMGAGISLTTIYLKLRQI